MSLNHSSSNSKKEIIIPNNVEDCLLCYHSTNDIGIFPCKHEICFDCIINHYNSWKITDMPLNEPNSVCVRKGCPFCRCSITNLNEQDDGLYRSVEDIILFNVELKHGLQTQIYHENVNAYLSTQIVTHGTMIDTFIRDKYSPLLNEEIEPLIWINNNKQKYILHEYILVSCALNRTDCTLKEQFPNLIVKYEIPLTIMSVHPKIIDSGASMGELADIALDQLDEINDMLHANDEHYDDPTFELARLENKGRPLVLALENDQYVDSSPEAIREDVRHEMLRQLELDLIQFRNEDLYNEGLAEGIVQDTPYVISRQIVHEQRSSISKRLKTINEKIAKHQFKGTIRYDPKHLTKKYKLPPPQPMYLLCLPPMIQNVDIDGIDIIMQHNENMVTGYNISTFDRQHWWNTLDTSGVNYGDYEDNSYIRNGTLLPLYNQMNNE